jgi:hypothetical protein
MSVTIEKVGRRAYLVGLPFAAKDEAKSVLEMTGSNWDGERRQWFVGTAKLAKAESFVAAINAAPTPPPTERKPQDPDDIRLTGKGRYKGREYFAGSITRDGLKVRLLTLPDASGKFLDFWAACSEVEQTKSYPPREYRGRTSYTTLGSISSFIAERKAERTSGEPLCAECGRGGELVADLEDGLLKHPRCCDIAP